MTQKAGHGTEGECNVVSTFSLSGGWYYTNRPKY